MNEIQHEVAAAGPLNANPVHPNAKSTTHVSNGTTTSKANLSSPICRNCNTQKTPLWRRDETGQVLCNACGLFLKLHGRPRPISLKTDTIKSRNRIKQYNPGKGGGAGTPELKSKEVKSEVNGSGTEQKKTTPSPKPKRKSPGDDSSSSSGGEEHSNAELTSLTPILPPGSSNLKAQGAGQFFPHPVNPLHSKQNHFIHQAHPLHYPSSTPTHFAPGLQRITSPLLLSSTSCLSNTRVLNNEGHQRSTSGHAGSNLSAVQAAGVLENMSNELGPNASFTSSADKKKTNPVVKSETGISSTTSSGQEPKSFTPSSALTAAAMQSVPPALQSFRKNNNESNSNVVSSPSFGPQYQLSAPPPSDSPKAQTPPNSALPHLSPKAGETTQLPPLQNLSSQVNNSGVPNFRSSLNNYDTRPPSLHRTQKSDDGSGKHEGNAGGPNSNNNPNNYNKPNSSRDGDDNNNNRNNNRNNNVDNNEAQVINTLKTRISELELVNDLYRTRIMELEAMEQAARLRELSMRKRLDGYYNLQNYSYSGVEGENQEHKAKKGKFDH